MKSIKIIYKRVAKYVPLKLRILIGPYIALLHYFWRVYIFTNTHKPRVLTSEKTLDLILKNKLSVIRFGDGELSIINKQDLGFQKTDTTLAEKLINIFHESNRGLLICIPNFWGKLTNMSSRTFWFSIHHILKYGDSWAKLISNNTTYGDALMTRPFTIYANKIESAMLFKKLFLLWDNEEVVLIEGSKSRIGVGNNMFNNTKSIHRIICPAENAYSVYANILHAATKIAKNKLVLISLGPTAKILAYDLFLLGFRVIDIGHIDMEYEMFLRNSEHIVKVPYKYFNEINERDPDECTDPFYKSQIIAEINL